MPAHVYELDDDPDPAPPRRGLRHYFIRDPGVLTRVLQFLLAVSLLSNLAGTVVGWLQMALYDRGGVTPEQAAADDARQFAYGVAHAVVAVVTGVTFLAWIYRANQNVRGFGARGLYFSPWWAVLCYYVPILNLWWPYQSMCEIWRASRDPVRWRRTPASPLLLAWWGLWLASDVLGRICLRLVVLGDTTRANEQALQAKVFIGCCLLDATLCAVAVVLVERVYRMQLDWVDGDDE